jgi:DNA-binding transcriptional MerR regulator
MYTIKEAANRSGVSVPLLRAWERRYGIVEPARTASGYRLYDEVALARLRTMRRLVDEGWTPSNAAAAVLDGRIPPDTAVEAGPAVVMADAVPVRDGAGVVHRPELVERFVSAAARLDAAEVEAVLDEMSADGTFEAVAEIHLQPALVALGEAWAAGAVDVAGEHAASHAVQRRLAAAYQAAGRATSATGAILVGLPPGVRHELGALMFATAARRAGLPVVYLGPDLPVADWLAAVRQARPVAVVIGATRRSDVRAALDVARALRDEDGRLPIAIGGRAGPAVLAALDGWQGTRPTVLPLDIRAEVETVVGLVGGAAA